MKECDSCLEISRLDPEREWDTEFRGKVIFVKHEMDLTMMDNFSSETDRRNTATVKYPG
jgi:hypothetical protein